MTEEDDIDGLAAEYVLGSLDPAEREHVDARRKTDASLADAIEAWQRRLGPLSEQAPGIEPPPHLLDSILSRISTQGPPTARTAEIVPFRRSSGRRLRIAISAGALAACLALAIVWLTHTPPPGEPPPPTQVTDVGCGSRYKDFWENFDRQKYARIPAEQLAGVSRMALRAYDACEAGDEQDAKSLFERLQRMPF
jgi:anti-sigma-K factor RskA